ncbi:MAG: hypothetical protein WC683_12690 [bacterium]
MRYNLSGSMADRISFDEAISRQIDSYSKEDVDYFRALTADEAAEQVLEASAVEYDDREEALARVKALVTVIWTL